MHEKLMFELRDAMPLQTGAFERTQKTGLVIVDEVNGFCTVGAGNLAPQVPNDQISSMITRTVSLAKSFEADGAPILAFLDTHEPGKPEPPYPPHCERGTGEENLIAELAWLEHATTATLIRKDCINGFVGAIDLRSGRNNFVDWVNEHQLDAIVVTGICTDICVMDFVLTTLSARNHGLMPSLRDVVVHAGAVSTYDLPREVALGAGLPETASHPQGPTHYMGLYFMASRGAMLASDIL